MSGHCKDYHKEYYQKNKERIKERTKRQSLIRRKKDPEHEMFLSARRRAKDGGYPFNITKEDIKIPKVCPFLGIPLYPSIGKVTPNSPSLDKLIPSKGYTRGNILVVSHRANTIKRDATLEELKLLLIGLAKALEENVNVT